MLTFNLTLRHSAVPPGIVWNQISNTTIKNCGIYLVVIIMLQNLWKILFYYVEKYANQQFLTNKLMKPEANMHTTTDNPNTAAIIKLNISDINHIDVNWITLIYVTRIESRFFLDFHWNRVSIAMSRVTHHPVSLTKIFGNIKSKGKALLYCLSRRASKWVVWGVRSLWLFILILASYCPRLRSWHFSRNFVISCSKM